MLFRSGWRVEIKKYPKLTEIGALRNETMIGKDWNSNDGVRYGGYENLVLQQRVQVLTLTIDTLKAEGQETRFFTSEQVAGFLQVSVQTVQGYIRSGKLKAIKPEKGGQFRVSHKALNDFILRSTVEVIEVCEC